MKTVTSTNPSLLRAFACAAVALISAAAFAASPAWMTAHDAELKQLIARMTLEEKAGQMTQPNVGDLKNIAEISRYGFGSVLDGGNDDPKTGNRLSDWTQLALDVQNEALKTRLRIPLLHGVDAVHGHNNVLGAVIFPHNIGLGCARDPALVEEIERVTAREVRATGIQWVFAPCVTVPQDIRWGRTYEGYSEDPAVVKLLGPAAVRGFQGADLSDPVAVLSCIKHAVGDGGTTCVMKDGKASLDQGDTKVDEATLRAIHLAGYPASIDAGAATIMPSYNSWNGVKCSGNKHLLTDILKKELGFEGFLISDYNAIDQIVPSAKKKDDPNDYGRIWAEDYKKCVEISINAGMDMVMLTDQYAQFIQALVELAKEGRIPMSRIDDAVLRILRVKYAAGLLKPGYKPGADPKLQREFGSAAHRDLARRAVRESVVLLKNSGNVLPLPASVKRIHVAGRGASDLGMQCGGWTIDWQGKLGEVTPGGTTLLAAMRQAVGLKAEITSSVDGSGAAGASVGIVVVGEPPYAEMKGDRGDLSLSSEDIAAVDAVKAAGVPLVVVVLSGRPVILGRVADKADAILAAWLPGTEGAGVADILTGAAAPKGKLSFTWPRTMEQAGPGRTKGTPQYPLGFGLTYSGERAR